MNEVYELYRHVITQFVSRYEFTDMQRAYLSHENLTLPKTPVESLWPAPQLDFTAFMTGVEHLYMDKADPEPPLDHDPRRTAINYGLS
jgi:hypothetical protein